MHQDFKDYDSSLAVTSGHFRLIKDKNRVHVFSLNVRGRQVLVHRGQVWLDHTGAWNVHYTTHADWLPINDCLELLGYRKGRGALSAL